MIRKIDNLEATLLLQEGKEPIVMVQYEVYPDNYTEFRVKRSHQFSLPEVLVSRLRTIIWDEIQSLELSKQNAN